MYHHYQHSYHKIVTTTMNIAIKTHNTESINDQNLHLSSHHYYKTTASTTTINTATATAATTTYATTTITTTSPLPL